MSPLWILPLITVACGAVLVARCTQAASEAARELAQRAHALGDLRENLGELRRTADEVGDKARSFRRPRPDVSRSDRLA